MSRPLQCDPIFCLGGHRIGHPIGPHGMTSSPPIRQARTTSLSGDAGNIPRVIQIHENHNYFFLKVTAFQHLKIVIHNSALLLIFCSEKNPRWFNQPPEKITKFAPEDRPSQKGKANVFQPSIFMVLYSLLLSGCPPKAIYHEIRLHDFQPLFLHGSLGENRIPP